MFQEYIEIRGARENNLKNVSLRIPKRKITIFTGVSGSGKSSIVFDTIATEAQRQLNENFSMFVRNFLPRYGQPEADAIENLSMAIVVDQKRLKLASELHKKGSIYIMDEPTTGLHMSDIGHLLAVINRLVDSGNTVIVIEHNLHIIKNADWIIDLGPEGGSKGGKVMFEGTPEQLLSAENSLTSAYLRN